MPSTKVLVIGLGGLGSLYAYLLKKAGAHISIVARSNYEAVKQNGGMKFNSVTYGENEFIVPDALYGSVDSISKDEQFDYIVCTNKALEPAKLPDQIEPAVKTNQTTIVLIQNGVGSELYMREKFPDNTIIATVSYVSARLDGPAEARQELAERLLIGAFDAKCDAQKINEFEQLLKSVNSAVVNEPKIYTEKWRKVANNCAFNGLSALTRLYADEVGNSSDTMSTVVKRLLIDVSKVAAAEGHDFDGGTESIHMVEKFKKMPHIRSSMLNDVLAGKPMEVEVILGIPAMLAKKHGIEVPTLDSIYSLVKGLDDMIRSNN